MFYNNIVKISEKLNKWNLLKIWLQVTYPIDFCMSWLHFYYGKKWKYLIFWKSMTRINVLYIGSYDKWFCIISWQKFANLLLLCKASSKKRLSERQVFLGRSLWSAICPRWQSTVLSTSLGKPFFAWCFILNENILFRLTISYQKPFVFSVPVFCSQICTLKLKFIAKNWSDLCNFYSKVIFLNFCLSKYFLLFFVEFELLMFHNNIHTCHKLLAEICESRLIFRGDLTKFCEIFIKITFKLIEISLKPLFWWIKHIKSIMLYNLELVLHKISF